MKNALYNFTRTQGDILLSPKLKDIPITILNNDEKQQILTFENVEPGVYRLLLLYTIVHTVANSFSIKQGKIKATSSNLLFFLKLS